MDDHLRLMSTQHLERSTGQQVRLAGWMQWVRILGKIGFIQLRDGAGETQIVVDEPSLIKLLRSLHPESVIEVEGMVVPAPVGKQLSSLEVRASTIRPLVRVVDTLPFELHQPHLSSSLTTLLDHAALRLRHPSQRSLFRIASGMISAFRACLDERDFVEIQTPKVLDRRTDGGADLIPVDHYGQQCYLSQGPQLHKQVMVGVLERVYEVAPIFHADAHATRWQLNEYSSLEVEMGFIQDESTLVALLTEVLSAMTKSVSTKFARDLEAIGAAAVRIPPSIPAITYADALDHIERERGVSLRGANSIPAAEKQWLSRWMLENSGSSIFYIMGDPYHVSSFYDRLNEIDNGYTRNFTLVVNGIGVAHGGQRLHRYEDYLAALAARGQDPGQFQDYLSIFRYGMPPHGGFAIGMPRLLTALFDLDNVRLATLFPRDAKRLTP